MKSSFSKHQHQNTCDAEIKICLNTLNSEKKKNPKNKKLHPQLEEQVRAERRMEQKLRERGRNRRAM